MLNQVVTVEKLIDFALLQLWYADYWSKVEKMPENVKTMQKHSFRQQAQGIVAFLYQTLGLSGSLQDYQGIQVPADWLPYFVSRSLKFEHPKEEKHENKTN